MVVRAVHCPTALCHAAYLCTLKSVDHVPQSSSELISLRDSKKLCVSIDYRDDVVMLDNELLTCLLSFERPPSYMQTSSRMLLKRHGRVNISFPSSPYPPRMPLNCVMLRTELDNAPSPYHPHPRPRPTPTHPPTHTHREEEEKVRIAGSGR